MKRLSPALFLPACLLALCFWISPDARAQTLAATHSYDGKVSHDVKRDRIIAISQDFSSLYYYVGPANIDYSAYTGATCPDPTTGWKTGVKYCWGGEDTPAIYLLRLTEGDGAGNKNTSSGSSYDSKCTGADCSGMASVCWTSSRYATSGFPGISDDVTYETLRMGDCTNDAGSHIRVFDHYAGDAATLMHYESTSGGGVLWRAVHRSLARDDGYQPIRYRSATYKVYDYPEPVVTSVRRSGVERVEIRWDGQADVGFRLEQSLDGAAWTRIRDTDDLPPALRQCEVSGLSPDTTVFFRMTSVNTGGETIVSGVAAVALNDVAPTTLIVDGADRAREQTGANHAFLVRVGQSLRSVGLAFDSCANEAVVDEQVDLTDYQTVVWILAEESTFDESFSWGEQQHVMPFLEGGGRLFVSGSEFAYDIDSKAESTTYKNGHPNDKTFCNNHLRVGYAGDDAATYASSGAPGSIFEGLAIAFDNGTHGAYDVAMPDQLTPLNGATAGLLYQGGAGGTACVYGSGAGLGSIVALGFGFETIYPEASRNAFLQTTCNFFDITPAPPTMKSVRRSGAGQATATWEGHGSRGFRLFQKTGDGAWARILDESTLTPETRSAAVSGIAAGTLCGFRIQAVNAAGPGPESDALCVRLGAASPEILLVDGYDRWNSQNAGANQSLLLRFGEALTSNSVAFESCANEDVVAGRVSLAGYRIVLWMCGEESTESETFGATEQALVAAYLQGGGRLFVSGSEIGWDLVAKADALNDYSNGAATDTSFFNGILRADYVADDAGAYSVAGAAGGPFDGLSFSFDNGTHGTYDVKYPDTIAARDGSTSCLTYGAGASTAAVCFTGAFPSGTEEGRLIYFAFPFETIYPAATATDVMARILDYFGAPPVGSGQSGWQCY